MVIIDSNIIISHLRQHQIKETEYMLLVKGNKEQFAISIISIQELYNGKSTKNAEEENFLLNCISSLKIIPYSYEIAQLAGEIMRDCEIPVQFADAAIAATAIINNARLYTLNKRDFSPIKGLQLY